MSLSFNCALFKDRWEARMLRGASSLQNDNEAARDTGGHEREAQWLKNLEDESPSPECLIPSTCQLKCSTAEVPTR